MAATLTLNFDDKTGDGLAKLVGILKQTAEVASDVSIEAEGLQDALSPGQFEQLQRALISMNVGMEGQSEQVQELRKQYEETIPQVVVMGNEQSKLAQKMEFWANAITVYEFASEKIGNLKDRFVELAKQAYVADRSMAVGVGIRAAIGYFTGLGTAVTGVYVGYKGLTGLMDSTGRTFIDIATGAETTSEAFREMEAQARNLGISVERHLADAGESLEDYGVRVESNLDRQREAVGKLSHEAARSFSEYGAAFKAGVVDPTVDFLRSEWKEFDRQMTFRTENFVENVGMMTNGIRSLRAAIIEASGGNGEAYKREVELLDQQAEITERLNKLNAESKDDIARAKEMNRLLEADIESEKEIVATRNMGISQIREELLMWKQKSAELAAAGKLDEKTTEEIYGRRLHLQRRLGELEEQAAKARNDALLKTFADQQKLVEAEDQKVRQANEQEYRDYLKSIDDKKRADEEASKERSRLVQEEYREKLNFIRKQRDEEKRLADEQARAQEARVKELATSFGSGMSLKDARGSSVDLERNALQQIGQLRQQATQQFVSGDVKGYMQSHQNAIQIYQQTLQQMKKLKDDFAKEGSVLDQVKGKFSNKDVLGQVADSRFLEAGKGLMEKSKDAFDAFRKQKAGGELSGDEERLSRQFQRDADKLQRDIMRQVNRDARNGRIGDDESARALNTLASRTVDTAQKQGKLNNDQAEGFRKAIEANAELAANAEAKSKQIEEMDKKLDDVIQQIRDDTSRSIAKARRGAR